MQRTCLLVSQLVGFDTFTLPQLFQGFAGVTTRARMKAWKLAMPVCPEGTPKTSTHSVARLPTPGVIRYSGRRHRAAELTVPSWPTRSAR